MTMQTTSAMALQIERDEGQLLLRRVVGLAFPAWSRTSYPPVCVEGGETTSDWQDIYGVHMVYTVAMKHLVDIDDDVLEAARRRLGTATMKDTVNTALRLAADEADQRSNVSEALDTLASFEFADREQAWR